LGYEGDLARDTTSQRLPTQPTKILSSASPPFGARWRGLGRVLGKRRKIVSSEPSLSQLRWSAFSVFLAFDNTQRSLFAFLLVFLVLGNHLIPTLTPLSRVCLELVSAVKQRPRALAEKRYTREQSLHHGRPRGGSELVCLVPSPPGNPCCPSRSSGWTSIRGRYRPRSNARVSAREGSRLPTISRVGFGGGGTSGHVPQDRPDTGSDAGQNCSD
jgi:hypothetical protein